MSKAKTNADELDLTSESEVVESSAENVVEPVVENKVDVVSKVVTTPSVSTRGTTSKMGLTKFLQKHPQTIYVTAILKLKYKSKVMTEEEWLEVVEEILDTEITA